MWLLVQACVPAQCTFFPKKSEGEGNGPGFAHFLAFRRAGLHSIQFHPSFASGAMHNEEGSPA